MSTAVLDPQSGDAASSRRASGPRHRRADRAPGRSSVRRDLEGLRAVAVLGVVIYHLRASWLPGGFAGVDVFFVLSGFFITGLLLRESERTGRVDLRAFWGRRARRLLPVSALVLFATLAAGLVWVDALDAGRFAEHGAFVALFGLNWALAHEGTDYLADTDPSPFQHYWSLGVEEQFYVVLPLVVLAIVLLARHRTGAVPSLLLGVVAVTGLASFVVALHQTVGNQPYAYFATYGRVWQLGLGVGLAAAAPQLGRIAVPVRALARLAGLAMIVGFYALAPLDIVYPGWAALWPTLGAGLIVAAGLPRADGAPVVFRGDLLNRALSSGPGQLIGRYSYGWYLWHWPPLVLIPLALGHRLTGRYLVLVGLGTLLLAVITYHLLENPVRASRALAARRGRGSLAIGVALVVLGLVAAIGAQRYADYDAKHSDVRSASGHRLTPQPAEAAKVQPLPTSDGCEVGLSSADLSKDCRYQKSDGAGEVVLLGDSHAVQWFPAVDSIAQDNGWGLRVWARASCPIADITKYFAGGPATNCNRWRDDIMKRVVAAKPRLVVLAGYASVVPRLYDRATNKLVGGPAAAAIYEQGLVKQLKRLRAAGIRVLMIRDTPSYLVAGPKCALANEDDTSKCSAPQKQALQTSADLDAARAVPGVQVLDLTDVFCRDGRCHQVIGDILAYRDTNHLSVRMVEELEPRVAAAAERAFG